MDVSTINAIQAGTAAAKPGVPAKAGTLTFSDAISNLLKDVNAQQLAADNAVQQMITGQADSVHDVVLSVAKADLAFRLVLEIRNRLMDSYQEVMRMQV
jgi:flagellar hook-basal body complex protein FliE